jgi:hypothetical protein
MRINMKGDNEKWLDLFIYLFIAGNPQKNIDTYLLFM